MKEQAGSYRQVKVAAEELKSAIRARYPEAQFKLARAADERRAWNLWTIVDVEDPDDVGDLVIDREVAMRVEERVPIYVVPTRSRERLGGRRPDSSRESPHVNSGRL